MLRITELRLPLGHAEPALRAAIVARLGASDAELTAFTIFKRSYDARKKSAVQLIYTIDCTLRDETVVFARLAGQPHIRPTPDTNYHFIGHAPADWPIDRRPLVVGFGPCGIFAALILAQMGLRPIVLERGKAVRERTQDTWGLWRKGVLNPESNVQFGEGGAGTFSDGKLWSQISDPRHLTRKVLSEFVKAGAPEEILFVAKAHIGTFRLVGVVEKMRAEIEALGGEVRFGQRVTDVLIEAGQVGGKGSETRHIRGVCSQAGSRSTPIMWCSRWATARATPSRCCTPAACSWRPSRSRSGFASSIRSRSSTRHASGRMPATLSSVRPTTNSSTMRRMAARSTASACAQAARWWRRPRRSAVSSPTA